MADRLEPNNPLHPDDSFTLAMPRRVQQRPHRCPKCGGSLEWKGRSRVEHFAWDYFNCPQGCGLCYLESGGHLLHELD
jgi:hypothetical protein